MLLTALILGMLIAWVDRRPTWDDTGITAGVLLIVSAGFGAVYPRFAWLWAITLGVWIPLFGIVIAHNVGSLLALAIAFIGAYVGSGARSLLSRTITSASSDRT